MERKETVRIRSDIAFQLDELTDAHITLRAHTYGLTKEQFVARLIGAGLYIDNEMDQSGMTMAPEVWKKVVRGR